MSRQDEQGGQGEHSGEQRTPEQRRRDRIKARVIASFLTLVGLAVTVLELGNILWPRADLPGGNVFWLIIGLMTLILGVVELILGPRQRDRER